MKSLEHIIREIREGKCECEKKKDSLEHAIRKVGKKQKEYEYESSYAAKDSKPVDEDVGGLIGSGTGGEPKLHAENGKKKKTDEAVGTIGTDQFQGKQFQSVTPHISPPVEGRGQGIAAAKKTELKRNNAKETASQTMHGRVTEEHLDEVAQFAAMAAPYIAPLLGATAAGVAGYMATKGKGKFPSFSSYDPEKAKQNDSYGTAAGRMKAMKFKPAEPAEAPPKTKPKHDEPVPGVIPDPSKPVKEPPAKPAEPEKAPAKPEEKPKTPPVTVPSPKPAEVPQEPPAKAIPAPKTPQPEIPPPLPAQTRPGKETKTTPKTPAPETPKEIPSTKPVELPAIDIPGVKTKPEVKPETKPDVKTDVDAKPKVAQLPAIDIGTKTKTATATDTKTATQTAAVPAATTPKSAATTTTPEEPSKPKLLGLGPGVSHDFAYDVKHRLASKTQTHFAKKHRMHEDTKTRETIENMPRKGDRKSIEYVGRKDADPKTAKEKTSRLATIKNVIDEAKKEAAVKKQTSFEDGKTRVYDYGKDVLIISPDQRKVDLDVDNNEKIPKDYVNK